MFEAVHHSALHSPHPPPASNQWGSQNPLPKANSSKKLLETKKERSPEEASVHETTSISYCHWIHGALVALPVVAIPALIGTLSPPDVVPRAPADLWYKCWGPNIVLLLIEIAAASMLAPKISFDMIEERSNGISIKESMRSILTSQGLIAALFLTIVCSMLQQDHPTDDEFGLLNQWYGCLLLAAMLMTMVGLTISIICLIYIEPLSDAASLRLISYGLMYFGEPLAYCGCAFVNTTVAVTVYVLGRFGLAVGLFGCLALFYCVTRVIVVVKYLSAWTNEEIVGEARAAREAWKTEFAHTGKLASPASSPRPPPPSSSGAVQLTDNISPSSSGAVQPTGNI